MFVTQHIRAKNDRNGNPRRCFVLYRIGKGSADVVDVVDEGYSGIPKLWRDYPQLPSVEVAPAEYRAFLGMSD